MQDAETLLRDSIHSISEFDPAIYKTATAPCVSIYLPTPHTARDMRRDDWTRIQFKDLRNEAERTLAEQYDERAYKGIVEKMDWLLENGDDPIWTTAKEGLAFLMNDTDAYVYNLSVAPESAVVVGDEYYIKPLLMNAQFGMDYYLLLLNAGNFGLLRGNYDHAHWVELPADVKAQFIDQFANSEEGAASKSDDIGALDYYTLEGHESPFHGYKSRNDVKQEEAEKFFRSVNKAMNDELVRDDPTPVILVTLPEHEHMFREIATFPTLQAEAILKDPCTVSGTELRDDAVKIVMDRRGKAIKELTDRYNLDVSKDRASDDLVKIGKALFEKDVEILFVEQGKGMPGTFDVATGAVDYDPAVDPTDDKKLDPASPDIVNAFAQAALKQDTKVIVLPAADMPTKNGVAAIYRWAEPNVIG